MPHHDMLVKLYDLKDDWSFIKEQEEKNIFIRKAIGPERSKIVKWAGEKFSEYWASEVERAMSNFPVSCFIAVQDKKLIGFACYDSTALGFFGPTGVDEVCRGKGTGKALLLACLLDMKLKGYAYAVIGAVGPAEFYAKSVGATLIPGSEQSIYKTLLSKDC